MTSVAPYILGFFGGAAAWLIVCWAWAWAFKRMDDAEVRGQKEWSRRFRGGK